MSKLIKVDLKTKKQGGFIKFSKKDNSKTLNCEIDIISKYLKKYGFKIIDSGIFEDYSKQC